MATRKELISSHMLITCRNHWYAGLNFPDIIVVAVSSTTERDFNEISLSPAWQSVTLLNHVRLDQPFLSVACGAWIRNNWSRAYNITYKCLALPFAQQSCKIIFAYVVKWHHKLGCHSCPDHDVDVIQQGLQLDLWPAREWGRGWKPRSSNWYNWVLNGGVATIKKEADAIIWNVQKEGRI